ncbi:phosphomannomutase/phosphoglucomutase [Neisseria sp. Ec49-e6-T10]|uniref:phosphomannomutase/phosphoglucomutase n=1 Tax=Neisseria sp. Ec49-e6-T10 TaxID=3140744 RepID=UPI003EB8C2E5
MIAQEIFKAYDIRGIVGKTLTDQDAYFIGRAIGTIAHERKISKIAVGRDGRLSGSLMQKQLIAGILDSGVSVLDVGMVATPMLYFAAYSHCHGSGVMVTGSHNPADYNGFKMLLGGISLSGEEIQALYQRIIKEDFNKPEEEGLINQLDVEQSYIDYIVKNIQLERRLSIAVDCGNGVAGAFAGKLYRELGCNVFELYCEVDGNFPNHHPDPSKPKNLLDLIKAVKEYDCDLGLAFDGDGDRLGVVTKEGNIIWPDRQLMLFSADVLQRNPGAKIIYDVKSTRNLAPWIQKHGGEPVLSRTGHSFIKMAMKETGALLAGEMSGHIFFRERWLGFDDGLYAGARLLEIVSAHESPSEVLNQLPDAISTPEINIEMEKEGDNHRLIEALQQEAHFDKAQNIIRIDGLRVEYEDGFGLMRASNTTPVLVLRFEANTQNALEYIQSQFQQVLNPYGFDLSAYLK